MQFCLITVRNISCNVFTSVCQEFCPQGGRVHTPLWADLGRHPPRQTPHSTVTTSPKMATAADGTHPTGMHSCLMWILDLWNTFVSMPRAYSDRYHCLHCVLLDGEHKTSTGIRLTFTWERALCTQNISMFIIRVNLPVSCL